MSKPDDCQVQSDSNHLRPWRGHLHDIRGHLTQTHRDPGLPGYYTDPSGLVNHAATPTDILNLSTCAGAEVRDHYRESELGSLEAIVSSDYGLLFEAERNSAHQVTRIISDQQNVVDIFEYDEHGRLTHRDSDETVNCVDDKYPCAARTDMPFLFGGAWRSPVTGISFMRNRWYDAKERQFLTTDPMMFVDSFDLYAYAGFDPVNRWDRLGEAQLREWIGHASSSMTQHYLCSSGEALAQTANALWASSPTSEETSK